MDIKVLEKELEKNDFGVEIIIERNNSENATSLRKLQRARVSPCRHRAMPITIISVGVNGTVGSRDGGRIGEEAQMRTAMRMPAAI